MITAEYYTNIAWYNDLNQLKKDINEVSKQVLLTKSAEFNYLDGIKLALKKGADIDYNNSDALKYAILNNHIKTAKYLIDNYADISKITCNNKNFNIPKEIKVYLRMKKFYRMMGSKMNLFKIKK